MARFPENTMRSHTIFAACASLLLIGGYQNAPTNPAAAVPQIYMQTEDSHPHEVLPGGVSAFPFWIANYAGYVDVKCTLSGDGVSVVLNLIGINPTGWAANQQKIILDKNELQIDIEGSVAEAGKTDVAFEFVNQSKTDLLWHQCYNN